MTEFEKAMNDYYECFEEHYPYFVGVGFPGATEQENIEIIQRCIAEKKPVAFEPEYHPENDY